MPRSVWLAGAVAGVLVWLAAPELQWPARMLTGFLLGPAPALFLSQAAAADVVARPLPRMPVYFASMAVLWALGILAVSAGGASGFTAHIMGMNSLPNVLLISWTGFVLLAGGAIVALFRGVGFRDADIMREITPVTAREKSVFVLLSLSAGVCEELCFRSFLIPALLVATGSLLGAVALSSLVFGMLHAHQKAGGALRAAVFGVVLAVPFVMTGSILPSMIAHTLIDIIGGLWLARWMLD